MTLKYIDDNDQVVTVTGVTLIQPIQNGFNILVESVGDPIIVRVKNVVSIV